MTGVAVKGLIGEPVVSGGGALAFYAAFAASSLITLYVMFNYTSMTLRATADVFDLRFGMKATSIALTDIAAVRVAEPKSRMTRVASQAQSGSRKISKMWSVLGVGSGIEIDIADDPAGATDGAGSTVTWFISSNDPEPLAEYLNSQISQDSDERVAEADQAEA